jgi:hypothetical protein
MNVKATIPERIKSRLRKDRPMTTVTIRMPEDVVESLKTIAPRLGFTGYQPLIKAYIGKCLRIDEERLFGNDVERFAAALAQRGVSQQTIDAARKALESSETPGDQTAA